MGKYSRELDQALIDKVNEHVQKINLVVYGIEFEAIKLNSKKSIGEVIKGNDLISLFANNESLVVIAINEDAFNMVDEEVQDFWIESLLSQVSYDDEKDKIIIQKPELNVNIGMYRKYGQKAVDRMELGYLTLQQMAEQEKEAKEAAKAAKAEKKAKRN